MDRIGETSSEHLQLLVAHASRAAVRGALEKGMSRLLILLRCTGAALLAAQSAVAVAEQNGYLVTNGVVPKRKHHDQRGTEE